MSPVPLRRHKGKAKQTQIGFGSLGNHWKSEYSFFTSFLQIRLSGARHNTMAVETLPLVVFLIQNYSQLARDRRLVLSDLQSTMSFAATLRLRACGQPAMDGCLVQVLVYGWFWYVRLILVDGLLGTLSLILKAIITTRILTVPQLKCNLLVIAARVTCTVWLRQGINMNNVYAIVFHVSDSFYHCLEAHSDFVWNKRILRMK